LKAEIAPVDERATVTALGSAGVPAAKLRLDAFGRLTSLGQIVTYDDDVGDTAVTLALIPVAVPGIVQLPLVPRTAKVAVSLAPSAPLRAPTLSAPGRVSANRHGVIGINELGVPVASARVAIATPLATAIDPTIAASFFEIRLFIVIPPSH
jgi:hypothetical protein